ncbi:hypothetical protein VOLCADRAFT_92324 [Volvox carteri f. nagariensis]|uniref:Uncharacterized protein n=1 Tax=Volvox carteri f. nagariensis TaxID=3068 RepID=D8TZD2_VOLCA|nr:uncharacterized protein VOLCADRAFT_92324 [Volvox carteri f. nagariensis]EFJ47161.1 hypothetical protein VOLCADRAFT_92324 [Volvox carteri f. nagariensis]|eukprot:XP_002951710.1 hypothetical protein VOLCADRAFT_92324 [Volvox carteri f. nagariensis]
MAGLGELERAKRRRLQEAYSDLRPVDKGIDDRQAKLRSLLLGAAADAGLAAADGIGSGPQAVRALAATAAASITAVESPLGRGNSSPGLAKTVPGSARRWAATTSPRDSATTAAAAAATCPPAMAASYGQAYGTAAAHSLAGTGGTGSDRRRGCPDGGAAAARAPPPGPMDGGFLRDSDPIQRLSRLRLPLAGGGGAAEAAMQSNLAVGLGRSGGGAAVAAVAQRYVDYNSGDDDDEVDVDVPSDVELALVAIKSDLRSHSASADLPPIVLRSQLSCLLTDRSTVERQLDEQRRSNRVRVFKLPTGSCRWHAATEVFIHRVVDRCTEFELSRDHMMHLMRTAPPQPRHQRQHQERPQQSARPVGQQHGMELSQEAVAAATSRAASAAASVTTNTASVAAISVSRVPLTQTLEAEAALDEQISLLLHLGCLARHTDGDADAFMLAVPGAGRLVKAVLGARRELLAWLAKRQHGEAPEEQVALAQFAPPFFFRRQVPPTPFP